MPRDDLILFYDLECTGAEDFDDMIEVGIALYTWPKWEEIGSFSSIVLPSPKARARMETKDVVREMHRKNGLSAEIDAIMGDPDAEFAYAPATVDRRIADWLKPYGPQHLIASGSGIMHYDRKFVKRQLPLYDKLITYWALDVGVLRRMWTRMGLPVAPDDGKTHRALDDARVHATEMIFYEKDIELIGRYKDLLD